ncbi:heparan-sulfate 6-O-sulfotransferase 2-like [Babylonia areolata]|uniref:heparan-sulfate 6-O-sulfotransferase 2-like n=1 Tax=Babylonia areolata TaxID=304850 RepID=UPI003FD1ACC9
MFYNTMVRTRYQKFAFVIIFVLSVFSIIFSVLFLHGRDKESELESFKSGFETFLAGTRGRFLQRNFTEDEIKKDYVLDLENEDVIVFLHIQKTGGTVFGKHLVENLDVDSPCHCKKRRKKKCECLTKHKQIWLFSRFSTGWRCGLHADWTELTTCVDDWFQSHYDNKKRRYHYITLLRDPVSRFISEWQHVRRGATWKNTALRCNGRQATLEEVPFCFTSENWMGVTLKDFMACQHNLALNRQTRMLANLSEINCYSAWTDPSPERQRRMLDSAKQNLLNLSFFGLLEFQRHTQFLFEHTFGIHFLRDLEQEEGRSGHMGLTERELKQITELNHLDVELYRFAKDLFLQRVHQAHAEENVSVPEQLQEGKNPLDSSSSLPAAALSVGAASGKQFESEKSLHGFHHKRLISRHPVMTKPS